MKHFFIIHRAAAEIGGNAVEVSDGETRLFFDVGLPLSSLKELLPPAAYRLKTEGLYYDQKPSVAAVFLTHAHLDHTGLLSELHPNIPVYASPVTINLLKNVSPLLGAPPVGKNTFIPIQNGQTVCIGRITVRAHSVDHSAAQSLAYEITVGDKTLLYSGDLRLHGACSYLTRRLMHRCTRPDYLLLEGTTLSRLKEHTLTEYGLRTQLLALLKKETRLPVIYFSAQNLDRLISVYKVARALHKTLVVDPYTCFVLENLSPASKSVVQFNWRNIRVYFAANGLTRALEKQLAKYVSKKITLDEILKNPKNFIVKDNAFIRRKLLSRKDDFHFIHSAWEGYLEGSSLVQEAEKYGFEITQLHTSGHASVSALQTLVKHIRPRCIIPVHTQCPQCYTEVFNFSVRVVKNGEKIIL